MTLSNSIKLGLSLLLLGLAVGLFLKYGRSQSGHSEQAFFYDLSEKRLFVAAREAVPPIQGLNDSQHDGVRAIVISTNGNPRDKTSWQVAYLETCSAELKRQIEMARASGSSPPMGRSRAITHRLVKRPNDPQWFPINSPEAERIVSQWQSAGPNGGPATICVP